MFLDSMSNVIRQAIKPARFTVMAKKVWKRLADEAGQLSKNENLAWIKANCEDFQTMIESLSPSIWMESREYCKSFKNEAEQKLAQSEFRAGGGGFYPLLYFVTLFSKPSVIVETGVAAGFSSQVFLSALSKNGIGTLYSSDFPYFRLPNPEKFIGFLVSPDLRNNWVLMIDGDEKNLPKIATQIKQVDVFHYDSDKTYSGKSFAVSTLSPLFHDRSILIFDDIQDDSFFHDYVAKNKPAKYHVFEFERKYVGVIGDLSWKFN